MTRTHYKVKAERARKSWMHLKKQLREEKDPKADLQLKAENTLNLQST